MKTRATLLQRLKRWDDQSGWQEFFDSYWKLIYAVGRKAGLNDAEAQDVVQETMLGAARLLPGFNYDPALGSFKSWLCQLTRWRILDQFRKRGPAGAAHPVKETESANLIEIMADNSANPDELWELEWKKSILETALDRIKTRLAPEKFQVFDFYVTKEWPAEKVAKTFNITVNQVYLVKNRVTEMLREEATRLEKSTN